VQQIHEIMTRTSPGPCPENLLFTGYHWETLRELYFLRQENWSKAAEIRSIRRKYKERLWDLGVDVDLERGLS
jgi:hypothetical protein